MINQCYESETYENIELNTSVNKNLEQLAVDVKHVDFQYNKKAKILENVNLRIPKGKILALLGPTGCGKTTIIKAILGRIKITSGSVDVFGVRPGSAQSDIPGPGVGYMPQELALFEEFTINEILTYYGIIYHIKSDELKKRITNLIHLLNLPEKSRPISKLSGGQQRRVSIAVTLIHFPKLVILDEPTVGVDSLLRYRIWNHLKELCRENGQTVIITTHYIEEAKSAANVAFMTSGSVLKQSNPQKLLIEYQKQTLEEVFLILCQNRIKRKKSINITQFNDIPEEYNEREDDSELDVINNNNNNNNETKVDENSDKVVKKSVDFTRIKAMLWKYYILTNRRPSFLLLFYVMPLLAFTALKFAVGQNPHNIPVAVYNMDANPTISRLFIDQMNKDYIHINEFRDNQSAFDSVVKGKNYISIVFPQNYSDAFELRISDLYNMDDEELDESKIRLYADFSNVAVGLFVLKEMYETFRRVADQLTPSIGYNLTRFLMPISFEEPLHGELDYNLASLFGPGITMMLAQILPMIISALQIINDRKNTSFERVFVAGVKPIEYFIAHLCQNLILIVTQVVISMVVVFVIFDMKQMGSYFDVYLMLLLQGLLGMAIGLFMALILSDEVSCAVGISALMFPLFIMSGVVWPIEAVPYYFRYITDLDPLTLPLESLRSIMFRGWSLDRPTVLYGYIITTVYTLIISFINVILFQKTTDKSFSILNLTLN